MGVAAAVPGVLTAVLCRLVSNLDYKVTDEDIKVRKYLTFDAPCSCQQARDRVSCVCASSFWIGRCRAYGTP